VQFILPALVSITAVGCDVEAEVAGFAAVDVLAELVWAAVNDAAIKSAPKLISILPMDAPRNLESLPRQQRNVALYVNSLDLYFATAVPS
jgi:hypothetical protein